MSGKWRFISADDHVVEHPDVWTSRMSRAVWGERIPHLERHIDGSDCWVVDGNRQPLLTGALTGDEALEPRTWDAVPDAAFSPAERLKLMDAAGAEYSVLYPTVAGLAGETFGRIEDSNLELACVQAYNDWLIEEWTGCSSRFIPQCIVPLHSIEASAAEIKRAVGRGHRAVIYPGVPRHLRENLPHLNDPRYDPLWAVCQELKVPICFHSGCSPELELPAYEGFSPTLTAAYESITRPASTIPILSNLIVSRILERFPGLKVVFGGSSLGWLSFVLEATDYEFDQFAVMDQIPYELHPSEAFRRQCYAVGWCGEASLRHACEYPGANNLLWSLNFPATFPLSPDPRSSIEQVFAKLSDDVREMILWRNAAELYHL